MGGIHIPISGVKNIAAAVSPCSGRCAPNSIHLWESRRARRTRRFFAEVIPRTIFCILLGRTTKINPSAELFRQGTTADIKQNLDGPRGCFWRVPRGCPCGEGYCQGLKSCRVARSFFLLQSGSRRKKSKPNLTTVGAIAHKCARYALGSSAFAGLK